MPDKLDTLTPEAHMKTLLRALLTCLLVPACAGCAIMNPYVYPSKTIPPDALPPKHDAAQFAGDIGPAIRYADSWRHTYARAAGQHAAMRNWSAAALLPLSATALFYGVTGHGSSDRITRLALGGASIYGANQYLTSNPRQDLYMQGAQALTCAITSTRPFIVTAGWLTELKDDTSKLTRELAELEKRHAALQAMVDDPGLTDIAAKSAAMTTLASASRAIADARALIVKSTQADLAILGAGHALTDAVRSITDFVYSQLPSTQPDLETLKALSGGLGEVASGLAGSAWPESGSASTPTDNVPPSISPEQDDDDGATAPPSISDARAQVAAAQSEVARSSVPVLVKIQSMVDIAEQTGKVANCTPRESILRFQITPSGETQTVGLGKFITMEARGGAGIPRYRVLGANTESIAVSVASQSLGLLVLNITGKAEVVVARAPTLVLTDGNEQKQIPVKVAVTK
ncbi:MAG: hypothetical protein M3414_09520 [Pseudomonadota bacterium]|nr:hypothetical protein [Pseudomonadota bacterium]